MFSYELNKLFLDISQSGYLPAKGLKIAKFLQRGIDALEKVIEHGDKILQGRRIP